MDTTLLAGTDADGLTVLRIANGVALRVLEGDEGDAEVALGILGEFLVDCGDVLEKGIGGEVNLVATLLEGHAKHLLVFDGSGTIRGIHLEDDVGALTL